MSLTFSLFSAAISQSIFLLFIWKDRFSFLRINSISEIDLFPRLGKLRSSTLLSWAIWPYFEMLFVKKQFFVLWERSAKLNLKFKAAKVELSILLMSLISLLLSISEVSNFIPKLKLFFLRRFFISW